MAYVSYRYFHLYIMGYWLGYPLSPGFDDAKAPFLPFSAIQKIYSPMISSWWYIMIYPNLIKTPLILQGAAKGHDFLLSSKALMALL